MSCRQCTTGAGPGAARPSSMACACSISSFPSAPLPWQRLRAKFPLECLTMKLRNKVCIVTGAASGIGREIALRFAAEGARVAIADLNKPAAQAVADEISARGAKAMAVALDVTSEDQVNAAVAAVVGAWETV